MQQTYEIKIITPLMLGYAISPPITAQINITRNVLSSANTCTIQVYNLKRSTRDLLNKDRYDQKSYWFISVSAGTPGNVSEVFRGNILESFSERKGADWVTSIEAFDGIFGTQNGATSRSYSENVDIKNMIKDVISDIPKIAVGIISNILPGNSGRGKALFGQSSEVLDELTDGNFFIDNEKVYAIGSNEYVKAYEAYELDEDKRITSPKKRKNLIDLTTILLPEIKVGQLVKLSGDNSPLSGDYKIIGFTHNILISQGSASTNTTSITLDAGTSALVPA